MLPFPSSHYALVERLPGTVLLESSLLEHENQRSYLFLHPVEILELPALDGIPELFRRVQQCLDRGLFVAGFMAYDCGVHFEPESGPEPVPLPSGPLAWFAAYERPHVFEHDSGTFTPALPETCLRLVDNSVDPADFAIDNCHLAIGEDEYCNRVERVRQYIAAGDTYQVNFTSKLKFGFRGRADACFAALRERQRVPYAAFLRVGDYRILSLSPELFFRIHDGRITSRPMKGTVRRGVNLEDDARASRWLHHDIKNRSENVMIVDLMRNDIGRLAVTGSVHVDELFAVEKYDTLFQMTSTVTATLRPQTGAYDIFRALFPCGSITGAPKVRTMQIIRELESEPRGVYTGSIGYFAPNGDAEFNVAIRTLVLHGNEGEMGAGGGIVYDSVPAHEHQECLLKAFFLTHSRPTFQLLESLPWHGSYYLLDLHLERLRASAEYFAFPYSETEIRSRLEQAQKALTPGSAYKVRLLLDRSGTAEVQSSSIATDVGDFSLPCSPGAEAKTVVLAESRTSSRDRFLYHKTTHRKFYEQQYEAAAQRGHEDVLFVNERGELTEATRNNVFLELAGKFYTPPVSSGLLPGVLRQHLLETVPEASERLLTLDDLRSAKAIYLCNSVRGIRKVRLVQE